jgi:hypothetical protein
MRSAPANWRRWRQATYQEAKGDNVTAAQADLDRRVKAFCQERYKPFEREKDEFVKATKHGENKEKVREIAAAIRKRLDATPATATPSATPALTPLPLAGATPSPR